MLPFLILVMCWCGRGMGLAYTGINLEGTQHAPFPPHQNPATTQIDPNTVRLFVNPFTSQNLQVNPQTTLPETSTAQKSTAVPNLSEPNAVERDDGYLAVEQREAVQSREGHQIIQGLNFATENEASVSPYWADPEGRHPNQAPPTTIEDLSPPPPTCRNLPVACNSSSRYRSISGRCNNLVFPHLGTPGQPMPRILPPVHDAALMRTLSVSGGLLPNPRLVSLLVTEAPPMPTTKHNLLLMQLGQFIDHDLSISPLSKRPRESKECEECSSWRDVECAPIPIPEKDPHLKSHDYYTGERRCLPFTRSGGVGNRDALTRLTLNQVNSNTAFLDLSTVYGNDECREKELRLYNGGLMVEAQKGFLPMEDEEHFEDCRSNKRKCFFAGDERCNEQMGLLVIHLIFFREHNRLAKIMSELNPHWSDERIFQEARRINIAQYQHIVYSEYLPELLGPSKVAEYRLSPENSGYYKGYDDRINPGVLNEFSTAAYRVGHTMVPDDLLLLDSHYMPVATVPLVQTFHNSSLAFVQGFCDKVLRGLVGTMLRPVDLQLQPAILHKLFEGQGDRGQDLFARNIARGRDHSIAPYTKYREACGGGPTASFEDLLQVMPQQAVAVLRKTYSHVDDVDLYTGGLAEAPVPGGLLGPTFSCIIAYQFLNSRRGDRFWYENVDNGLTPTQLNTIRSSTSLSRLLCENMDEEDSKMPVKPFFLPSKRENSLMLCDLLPSIDKSAWQEQPHPQEVQCNFLDQSYPPNRYVHVSPCLVCICHAHGHMRCKPNLAGCQHTDHDDHCKLLC